MLDRSHIHGVLKRPEIIFQLGKVNREIWGLWGRVSFTWIFDTEEMDILNICRILSSWR